MTTNSSGKFVWFEYISTQAPKAQGFFGELFGWSKRNVPMPGGDYTMIALGGGRMPSFVDLPLPLIERLTAYLLQPDDPSKAIDLIVVSDELRRRNLLEYVGGQDYMIQLAESFADWANAEHYARIVRDKGMLRDLIRCAGEIADEAYSNVDDVRQQHIMSGRGELELD